MKQFNDLIADFWRDYAALVLLGAGLVGVLALISLGVWAKRSRKPLRPIALAVSMNLALLLNAEGMWVIAIDQLKLPPVFAVLVFAVFEICFLTATSLAAEQYRRTTTYGPDGEIVTPGHPGSMLYIAALIAAVSGIIVASNAVTGTEKLLRLAVPCVIFLMWWAALTAAGQRIRRGRFAYSPRRLAERWGWLIPDDDPDLVRMASDRQVRRMIVNHHRVSAGRWPRPWWRSRLLKDARTAGEPVVADVIQQVARIQRVMDLLVPGGAGMPTIDRDRLAAAMAPPAVAPPVPVAVPEEVPVPVPVPDAVAVQPVAPAPAPVQPVQFVPPVQRPAVVVDPPAAPEPVVVAVEVPAQRRPVAEPELPAAPVTEFVARAVPGAPAPPNGTAVTAPVAGVAVPAPVAVHPVVPVPVPVPVPAPVAVPSTVAVPAPELEDAPVSAVPVSPAVPAWASTGTGARPAVTIVGSPWWRLAVERLARLVAAEISPEDLPAMTYLRVTELARALAPRVSELGEGVVRAFVNDYVRELNGEHVESAYPWRDLLPEPATAPAHSSAWMTALEELRDALVEELGHGEPRDARELAELLAPSAPRLDDVTIHGFITDYLLALGGQSNSGSSEPWQHLLPRPQAGRGPTDEEVLEVYGDLLDEHLRTTGRLSRYRVQSVTGVKSKIQADRIKAAVEDRAARSASAAH
ncbi:MFS transporter [Actinoplanes sp. NPDC051861]|uniref:MFS transporter n=1 Tax=Actinoplanes sp. NPDC051861 TaxID=3155170 RepID=UPI0034433721